MLTSLRIQNFRSIRDASVKLGQVNLFIGPNNSGKSNFLKGIELVARVAQAYPAGYSPKVPLEFISQLPRSISDYSVLTKEYIRFSVGFSENKLLSFGTSLEKPIQIFTPQFTLPTLADFSDFNYNSTSEEAPYKDFKELKHLLIGTGIYHTVLSSINFTSNILRDRKLAYNGANIISFLFNLIQDNRKKFKELEDDFAHCVTGLVFIETPLNPDVDQPGTFKLRFSDQDGAKYWAEEVSDGVLYFLALLCIVHQPDPPKLLLLEEPEKGIHPRRIREVMDFIFELARMRDIQIILTSHSPYVVDHFKDIPECISVFDRENGETVIRNAKDIMDAKNAELRAVGEEPIHFSDGLGEYWVSGFLGGVPDVLGTEARPA